MDARPGGPFALIYLLYSHTMNAPKKEVQNMKVYRNVFALAIAPLFGISSQVLAQDPAALANDPKLFVEVATRLLKWNDPAEPTKIVGPIYFVGTAGLGVWLITTFEGNILLNTGIPPSGRMIESSIRRLGFKPEDIKLLLTCHAHVDHVGGHAYIKKISGTQVAMIDAEADLLQAGGKTDFHYGKVPSSGLSQ